MANANIINLKNSSFIEEVEKSAIPVLVDFWAPWCGPCRAVGPIFEQLAAKYEGKVKFGKVNVDDESELASKFRVMSIPTLILFKDGAVVQQIVGLRSVQEFEDMINKAL